MLVKILGSAAGGAFPQWNCGCPNCRAVRSGAFRGKPRSQTQVAISADGGHWLLLGASPDLRSQIEAARELHPREASRNSPIAGVLLANADVDHVLGTLLLRELHPLRIYATASVQSILRQDNSMFAMLQRVPGQVIWETVRPGAEFAVSGPNGVETGIRCRGLSLASHYPAYAGSRRQALDLAEASLGFLVDAPGGRRLGYFPAVPGLTGQLIHDFEACDVLLFDGTFWSDDELIRAQGGGQTARQMGHVPVEETLKQLAVLHRPRKIFLHINNTNPILDEASPERRQARNAGWEVAEDGWQFDL